MSSRNARFEIRKSSDDQFYVVLVASNGEDLMRSERYTRKDGAERGVEAIQRAVTDIEVRDAS